MEANRYAFIKGGGPAQILTEPGVLVAVVASTGGCDVVLYDTASGETAGTEIGRVTEQGHVSFEVAVTVGLYATCTSSGDSITGEGATVVYAV